jgi:hypothetical protein
MARGKKRAVGRREFLKGGISKDHPLRFGTATGAGRGSHIPVKSR